MIDIIEFIGYYKSTKRITFNKHMLNAASFSILIQKLTDLGHKMKDGIKKPAILELEKENKRLKRAVEELSILNELAREIGAASNSQAIMQKIISRSIRALHGEQGTIILVDESQKSSSQTLVRSMVSSASHQPFHMNQALLGYMILHKKPLLLSNPQSDSRFVGVQWEGDIENLLCVPLIIKSHVIGILTVLNKKGGRSFTEGDQRLLTIIAGQSAQVIENARLYEEEQKLLVMQEQLRLAYEIQTGLLPKSVPNIPGYEVAGISIPAQVVGGDYYDFITIEEGRFAVCLGDVSGKGLPAAMVMANLQATIRAQTLEACSPCICLKRSNKLMYKSTEPQTFATFFYGVLDSQYHHFHYSNAGHDRPILFSEQKEPQQIMETGIPLAFLDDFDYLENTLILEPNDMLLVYSDGITESMNENDEEFGIERIMECVSKHKDSSPKIIIEKLIESTKIFSGKQPQSDDKTILIVKRKKI
jgi:phosphoserine phosphatase RsbU/P